MYAVCDGELILRFIIENVGRLASESRHSSRCLAVHTISAKDIICVRPSSHQSHYPFLAGAFTALASLFIPVECTHYNISSVIDNCVAHRMIWNTDLMGAPIWPLPYPHSGHASRPRSVCLGGIWCPIGPDQIDKEQNIWTRESHDG